MRIDALLQRLPQGSIVKKYYADPDREVYTLSFLTFDHMDLRPDVLYFGDPTQLPPVPDNAFANFIVFGGESSEGFGRANNINAVMLSPEADLYACFNAIQAFFMEDQALTDAVRRLLTAHFSNRGLQYLVEEASLALDNPIFVVDTSYRYTAWHLGELDDSTAFGRIMRKDMDDRSVQKDGVTYITHEKVDERLSNQSGPLVSYNSHLELDTMTDVVMVHGVIFAHVFMVARNHPFTDLDREVFSRLTHFVGQELQKLPVYESNKGQMWSYFLVELLDDEQPSPAVIERRQEVVDYHPWDTLYVLALRPKTHALTPEAAANVRNQLMPILVHCLSALYQGTLVVVLNRHNGEDVGDYAEDVLRKVAATNGLSVGISNPFHKLVDIRTHYGQATDAIVYGTIVAHAIDDHDLFHYRDYAYVQLLAETDREHDLLTFCHPALHRLLDYDERHGTELVETLFEYLQNASNTTRTAGMLNLHKNTLLYRLGRIRDIIGCDLTSGEDLFQFSFSYRILLYLGLYSPRIRVQRDDLRKAE